MGWLPGYLTKRERWDSREFSTIRILSSVRKGDKTRHRPSVREISQTLGAPGELIKIADSWTLCQRFWPWRWWEGKWYVWYQPSKWILIKMALWLTPLELEAQCQELEWGKREQCGQREVAPTVRSVDLHLHTWPPCSYLSVHGTVCADGMDSLWIRAMIYFFMCLLCLEFHWCQLSETGLWNLAVMQLNGQSCLQRGKGEEGLCTELEASQYSWFIIHLIIGPHNPYFSLFTYSVIVNNKLNIQALTTQNKN